jgi:hypothetical protein
MRFSINVPVALQEKLVAVGASVFEEQKVDEGSHLIMWRDPWGVLLQLCKRAKPMV